MKKINNMTYSKFNIKTISILMLFAIFSFNISFAQEVKNMNKKEVREKFEQFKKLSPQEKQEFIKKLDTQEREKLKKIRDYIKQNPDKIKREHITREEFLKHRGEFRPFGKQDFDNKPPKPPKIKICENCIQEREERFKDRVKKAEIIRQEFENRKRKIVEDYNNKKISREKAIRFLNNEKNRLMHMYQEEVKQTAIKVRKDVLLKLKDAIKSKIEPKLVEIKKSSQEKQEEFYLNIISRIDNLLRNNKLEENKKILYILMKEVLLKELKILK